MDTKNGCREVWRTLSDSRYISVCQFRRLTYKLLKQRSRQCPHKNVVIVDSTQAMLSERCVPGMQECVDMSYCCLNILLCYIR